MRCEHTERVVAYLGEICGVDWLAELTEPIDASILEHFVFNHAHSCSWRRGALEVLGELIEARDFEVQRQEAWLYQVPPEGGVH